MTDPNHAIHWQFTDEPDASLESFISPDYTLRADEELSDSIELYDTFDRALTQAGLALLRRDRRFQIAFADDLRSGSIEAGEAPAERPLFWRDFPKGDARKVLRRHLGLRAATSLASLQRRSQLHLLRNGDEKIVARLWSESASVPKGDSPLQSLSLSPLLGYEEDAEAIAQGLDQAPFLTRGVEPLGHWALRASGKEQAPLSPKQAIRLRPDQTVQEAVTEIASFMIKVARQYEPGIVEDIDSEFLHDYRVSIRKIRSVLSLITGAYPKAEAKRLKRAFRDLAAATSRLRDLDVYLVDEDRYRSLLPPALQDGLDRMFADFRKRRSRERGKVKRHFQSAAYREEMASHEDWFAQERLPKGARADRPILQIAAKEIRRHYKLVRRRGRELSRFTPDEEVHALRLECKKLRYLLELFSSLFPEGDIKAVEKKLKGLQNTLGSFNDAAVQSRFLSDYLVQAKSLDRPTAAAVGGVVAELHRAQLEARSKVARRFAAFDQAATRRRFHKLFKRPDSPSP